MSINTFTPRKLPNIPIKWERLIEPIGKAHDMIGRFDEMIKNAGTHLGIFSILKTEEAVWSMESQKKNDPRADLAEVLIFEACGEAKEEKIIGIKDIIYYRTALEKASLQIVNGPISLSLFRKMHAIVKKNSTASKNDIGRFRTRQNWIGPIGCNFEDAYFYPPPVHLVKNSMENLEKYIHYKEKDLLAQLAVVFAQLLIVHPFMDGNGRISRLIIPLFLFKKGLTSKPMFYMSRYFQKNRIAYLEKLYNTSMGNDWEGWIRFFLTGMIKEGESNLKKMKKIQSLYQSLKLQILESSTPKLTKKILDSLFQYPIFTRDQLVHRCGACKGSVDKALKNLASKKWIKFIRKSSLRTQQLIKFEALIKIVSNHL